MATHTLTLRAHFETALAALVAETKATADTIILNAVESALSRKVDEQEQSAKLAKLTALDAAKDTDTKAVILSKVGAVVATK